MDAPRLAPLLLLLLAGCLGRLQSAEDLEVASVPVPEGEPVQPEEVETPDSEEPEGPSEQPEDAPSWISSDEAQPAGGFEVLRKTKYFITGAAVTAEELQAATDSNDQLVKAEFDGLVQTWMNSPDFTEKRRHFFMLALQQDPANRNYQRQLRNTNGLKISPVLNNLEDSIIRTAERIYQEKEDFRSIVYTTEHEVTTATLLILTMLDNPFFLSRIGNPDGASSNSPRDLIDLVYEDGDPDYQSDTSDWRTVDLQFDPTSTEMQEAGPFDDGTNLAFLRSVRDGGTIRLRTPRTACSSPAFFQKWETNADNRFRVHVNQCFIIALGTSFAVDDPTRPNLETLPGLNPQEIPGTADCMGCHKNMDPMLSAYEAHFEYESQRFRPNSVESAEFYNAESGRALGYNPDNNRRDPFYTYQGFPEPYFSFQGVNQQGQNLLSILQATATHPESAMAWTLKVCQYSSSTHCERDDPEMIRVAEAFAASGFRLDVLFYQFFTSKFMTHTYAEDETAYPGAQVSVSRRDHYCQALKVRLREARRVQGRGDLTSNTNLCGQNSKLAEGIPDSSALRGDTGFNLPREASAFSSISLANLCSARPDRVVGGGNRTFVRGDDRAEATISVMVEQLYGFPSGTDLYSETKGRLIKLYALFRSGASICEDAPAVQEAVLLEEPNCGLGLSEQDAMESLFMLACQNPILTTMGL